MRRISFCAAAVLLSLSSGLPAAEKPKDAKPQTLSDKLPPDRAVPGRTIRGCDRSPA